MHETTPTAIDESLLTHEYATVNDVKLHSVTAGPQDGDLVVLLHGFPEFWYSWRHQIPVLAEAGYRVVVPDMRGYNRSAKPAGVDAYHIDELVADVVGLIEHHGREQAHVVGHDWGGLVAWHLGIHRPAVVDRLVVLNSPHPSHYERRLRRSPSQLLQSWYVLFFQVPKLPERLLRRDDFAAIESMLRELPTTDAFTDEDIERYKSALSTPGSLTAALNYYRAMFRRNAKLTLKRGGVGDQPVDVPTLLLWGEQDHALDVELSDGVGEWVSDLRVERFPEASHWVHLDARERVNEALVDFLAEPRPRQSRG